MVGQKNDRRHSKTASQTLNNSKSLETYGRNYSGVNQFVDFNTAHNPKIIISPRETNCKCCGSTSKPVLYPDMSHYPYSNERVTTN